MSGKVWLAGAAFGLGLFAGGGSAQATAMEAPPPPVKSIKLTLKPHVAAGKVDYIDICMVLGEPAEAPGQTLVRLPLVVASIPTQRYDGAAISAFDSAGPLPLTIIDAPPTSFLTNRDWSPARPTVGDVTLKFRAKPREVDAKTRNGPLFDLREEAGGLDGAGYTFLPTPLSDNPIKVQLHWDLADMAPGARGVWSLGEADTTTLRPANILQHSYYFAGPVKSYPAKADSKFGLYWLAEPPFDANALGDTLRKLFASMSGFFQDRGEPYRIFIRKQPYKGDGGTGLTRSFLFGWGTGKAPTLESLKGLIAHEMVHNWPSMDGDHADTSWYTEGSAEYYSELLLLRSGLHTPDQFLKGVDKKAEDYFTNPLQTLSNRAADAIYWKDSRAGHVPYGRGFMYLAILDAKIRKASGGKRSLRDLELAIQDKQRRHEEAGLDQWKALVQSELGSEGVKDYDAMASGQRLVPPAYVFAPCFKSEAYSVEPVEFGFNVANVKGPGSKIMGVIAGSNAAKAGLQDGDEVVEAPDLGAPMLSSEASITLKIRRGGLDKIVTYAPRGVAIEAWRWARQAGVPDQACKL